LLSDAYWGDLDILFIDLPPGTGDLAISLGQLIPTSEILVITTPQIAAAEVAERAGRIAHQIHQRVIGVIENMSANTCANCGEEIAKVEIKVRQWLSVHLIAQVLRQLTQLLRSL
jgi:ATP-binding protein involved in chromosome partitioning